MLGKVTEFGGNWLKIKNVASKKNKLGWKTPPSPPPVLIGLID